MSVLIPKEKLHEGFERGKEQVSLLLQDARHLYDGEKFVSAIALTILANEEVGKLNVIRTHIVEKRDILDSEWEELSKMGSHGNKLLRFYELGYNTLEEIGEEKYNKLIEDEKRKGSNVKFKKYSELISHKSKMHEMLKRLNNIKKGCFYLDWKNNSWVTMLTIYDEHETALLANFLLDFTGYEFFTELLDYKYQNGNVEDKKNDSLWEEREKYTQRIYTKEYEGFFSAINYLINKFP